MKFDLPFHFNQEYEAFIQANEAFIYSIYYASTLSLPGDARIANTKVTKEAAVAHLKSLTVKKYMTLNGRMTALSDYEPEKVKASVSEIAYLNENGALDGIIVLDFYHLKMLVAAGLNTDLDIIPSVNMGLDTTEKVNSTIQQIQKLGFKVPTKIILDRGLNRNFERLQSVVKSLRRDYDIKIELLVNEGCIQHCPYKINHDILISTANDQSVETKTLIHNVGKKGFDISTVNEKFGCIAHFQDRPEDVLKIPFIRPEDIDTYAPYYDIIKVSVKIKSNEFVYRVFGAYLARQWDSNLLDILDATGSTAKDLYVFNDQLPATFMKVRSSCESRCHKCDFCNVVAKQSIQKLKGKGLT